MVEVFEMRKFINACVFLLCTVGFAYPAFAQQQAGPVIDDIHRRNNPNHPGYVGNNAAAPVVPREVWRSKYGALAADYTTGRFGISEDANSISAARREALRQCGDSKNCKIVGSVANGCLAMAYGGGGSAIGVGELMNHAAQDAMRKCQSDGSSCEIHYAHCNNPVRIR